jgi:hypothetical protein
MKKNKNILQYRQKYKIDVIQNQKSVNKKRESIIKVIKKN